MISAKPACGWPAKTWPGERTVCPCGFIFPDKVTAEFPHWHGGTDYDAWLADDDEEDMDFG